MGRRSKVEQTWGVLKDGDLCGIVGYLPITGRMGTFHGICFARQVHGQGVAKEAVSQVLAGLFASGVEKVTAGFFADNSRIHDFLAGLGAVDEGRLRAQTLRGGKLTDMQLIAIFKENFVCHLADY